MEKQFNDLLNDIRTTMTTGLYAARQTGADVNAAASFRQKLKADISVYKGKIVLMRRHTADVHTLEVRMLHQLDELLEIMGSPHPEFARAGFYVSPNKPAEPLYFWAYQDLCKLGEWIQESCNADASKSAFLPQALQEMVRHEFDGLKEIAAGLRQRGIGEDLVKTLMQPFDRFRKPEPPDLIHRDLVNLRKLRDAIQARCKNPDEKLDHALNALFYELNVNTKEVATYCKAHIREKLSHAGSEAGRLEVLALEEKFIRQATIESNALSFDPYRDKRLADEMLEFIAADYDCRTKVMKPHTPIDTTAAGASTDGSASITVGVPNEHYAATCRVQQEIGFLVGSDKHIVEVTSRLVHSNKNREIAFATFYKNYHTPTGPGVKGAFHTAMKQVVWIQRNWCAYGIPIMEDMNPHDLKRFILSYKIE